MRYVFTMTDAMYEDLKSIADEKDTTLAQLIRGYLSKSIIQETGRDSEDYRVIQGGDRTRTEE